MLIIENDRILPVLKYDRLISKLYETFLSDFKMPLRHHHFYQNAAGAENTLILMPAWNEQYLGIKQVTVAPSNGELGLPAIYANYSLMDSRTGQPLAQMDAAELTSRRTACTSALAASYLAKPDAETLLVVGAGKVAQHLVQAHCVVRKYKRIMIWARNASKGEVLTDSLLQLGYVAESVTDLEQSVRVADVVSCATLSSSPLISGAWLRNGTHLDLIGSHTPATREVDNEAILKSTVYVDSREALHETGELAIPIADGIFDANNVKADIVELCRHNKMMRKDDSEITLFKSAGLAIEDLAAATLVYESIQS